MNELKLKSQDKTPMYELPDGRQVFKIVRKYQNDWGQTVVYEFFVVKQNALLTSTYRKRQRTRTDVKTKLRSRILPPDRCVPPKVG